jgi:hypothetical protein
VSLRGPVFRMTEIHEQFGVRLSRFAAEQIDDSFVASAFEHGRLRVHSLDKGLFAVELAGPQRSNRYLTQTEVDSLHYDVRASDGIRELRVTLA